MDKYIQDLRKTAKITINEELLKDETVKPGAGPEPGKPEAAGKPEATQQPDSGTAPQPKK